MALTLNVPPPAERQLTEVKWIVAEKQLQSDPTLQTADVLLTPQHTYTVVRKTDGSLTRIRTKSQEDTNADVDLASPLGAGRLLALLVGVQSDTGGTGM